MQHCNNTDKPRPARRRLGEVLCDRGAITPRQLEQALQEQAQREPRPQLGDIIVELGLASRAVVCEALARSVGTPFVVLRPAMVQRDALQKLPDDFIEKHNLLPMTCTEGWLTIAVAEFTNVFLLEDVRRRAGCNIQVVAADADNIRDTRAAVRESVPIEKSGGGLAAILEQIDIDDVKVVDYDDAADDADLETDAAESPVVKLVNYIVQSAVEARASDIHIEPEDPGFRVRYRVDGELTETVRPAAKLLPAVVSRIKIMAGLDISERRLPQDGAMTVTLADRAIDLRVSTMATKFGEKVVMRIVDHDAGVDNLDALSFEPAMLSRFRGVVKACNGIVLVTGPTGSGKTTTLYAALNEILSVKRNISTIEDPVERRLNGTNQFQIHPQAGFTFAKALRSLLRQDPDVVMIGEIRDTETAKLAAEAALTGHLVLSTLHTNDAPTAVPRLINMGVEPYLVAASLRGVLAQRLVRRMCANCVVQQPLTDSQRNMVAAMCGGQHPIETAPCAEGCSRCGQSGFAGRVGLFELLILNEEMLSSVARDPGGVQLRQQIMDAGFETMVVDGITKVGKGLIGLDQLFEVVVHAGDVVHAEEIPSRTAA